MTENKIDDIIEKILRFFPVFYKNLLRNKKIRHQPNIPNSSFHILSMLKKHGPKPISEIGRRLLITKSNMTPLIDKLIMEKKVIRIHDSNDRRIINISITPAGMAFLINQRNKIKTIIKDNLSQLDPKDTNELYESLDKIQNILSKLNKEN